MPASKPLMMNAAEMTRFAGTPMSRVVVNLSAAARIAMPSTVFFMSNDMSTQHDRRRADDEQVAQRRGRSRDGDRLREERAAAARHARAATP